MMSSLQKIILKSSEGQEFKVDRDVAEKSQTLKHLIEDVVEDQSIPIPLPNVTGPILAKVLEYCEHHRNDMQAASEDQDPSKPQQWEESDEWDVNFVKVDQGTLFELILAANYLDIKPLLDLTCKTVAYMIKGKTSEEIRKTFGIVNDFTPEEEEQIRRENEWCEDRP
ncbi:hypothetical protein MIR68_000603 [Amoeboaphelidium protococcarum]|nr:hypothetical protein MIR68_010709 [Amoeboaphelidium protococcarum]KAI3641473.1 hypothetical protein MIR68_000603 [Amoeboaphelidium protococcarum]KAI3642287.1 hypothetical protein MP228_011842 [Amoeboaphelidium protococcarum]